MEECSSYVSLSDLQLITSFLLSTELFQGRKEIGRRPWDACIQKAARWAVSGTHPQQGSSTGPEGIEQSSLCWNCRRVEHHPPKDRRRNFHYISDTPSVKPLVKQNRALTISSMHFSFFFLILFFLYAFFHSFQYLRFFSVDFLFFFICQKISFLLPQISFSFLLLMWLFCVSLSTPKAYFSLFTVFATWRNAIEKLKVDCMGISYFSFTSRSPFLFPPISVKCTILRCFRPSLPNHFTPLSLSCSVFPLCLPLHLLLLDI